MDFEITQKWHFPAYGNTGRDPARRENVEILHKIAKKSKSGIISPNFGILHGGMGHKARGGSDPPFLAQPELSHQPHLVGGVDPTYEVGLVEGVVS